MYQDQEDERALPGETEHRIEQVVPGLEPAEHAVGKKASSARRRLLTQGTLIACCMVFPLLLLLVGFAWLYVAIFSPRVFAGVKSLQIASPVCGNWQTISGSVFGSNVPKVDKLAVIGPDNLWALTSGSKIHHWNGLQWTEVELPRPSTGGDVSLYGINGLTTGEMWVVGSHEDPTSGDQTLSYHWDGKRWAIVGTPNVKQASNELRSVVAIDSADAWAVGSYTVGYQSYSLVLHWDGNQWSRMSTPNSCIGDQYLRDIMSVTANDVWALGGCSNGTLGGFTDIVQTLVQHWDGINWQIVPSPNHRDLQGNTLVTRSSSLERLAGTGHNDLWAGGYYMDTDGKGFWTQPMLAHWDGNHWNEVTFKRPGAFAMSYVSDLAAIAPNDVWAVGSYLGGNMTPVVVHWDGIDWSEVPNPNPLAEGGYDAIAALGSGAIWAAGFGFDSEDGPQYGLFARFKRQPCPTGSHR